MDIHGTYTFDAAVDTVWTQLMNPTVIAACIPGCSALRPLGDDRFQAELVVGVAAVTGTYDATIAIQEKNAPVSYVLLVDGTGKHGFLRGRAVIELAPSENRTVVRINATGDIGGTVARMGQRILQSAGRMMMDRFFKCFGRRLSPNSAANDDGAASP